MATPVQITIDLDWDSYIAGYRRQWEDDDGEPHFTGPDSVEELIIDRAAKALAERAVKGQNEMAGEWGTLVAKVKEIRTEEIRARIIPAVEEAIARPILKTNEWGETRGPETTLREEIINVTQNYLKKPARDNYGRDNVTTVQAFIQSEVKKAVDDELKSALDAARAEVAAAVKERASEVLAETIQKLAAGR